MPKLKVVIIYFFLSSFYCLFSQNEKIKLGIDVLVESNFSILQGKRVGLLANSSSRSSTGKMTVEYFLDNSNFILTALFAPEHGFFASVPAGRTVPDDTLYGIPVFSLYGNNRKPTPYQMSLVDIIVVDLQDIGIRSYTYISTLYKVMEACAEFNIPIVVLDRPNPLGGNLVDGNVLEQEKISFVGIAPIPYLHGMTIGEIATMINEENWLAINGIKKKSNLTIIRMQNWKRSMRWEETGLTWYPTSPNIPTPDAIRGAAMLGVLGELRLFDLGIGSDNPFQFFGIPRARFKKTKELFLKLNFEGITYKENTQSRFSNKRKHKTSGIYLQFDRTKDLKLYTYGILLLFNIAKLFPELLSENKLKPYAKQMFIKVTGTEKILNAILSKNESELKQALSEGLNDFIKLRSKYLFYK
ncbi:MAG: DUF1343 domain-containing protein [Ignavibacteria bacterium]|nr:DUF1343 domain-containing protein [Ignavibacteria bacterium]